MQLLHAEVNCLLDFHNVFIRQEFKTYYSHFSPLVTFRYPNMKSVPVDYFIPYLFRVVSTVPFQVIEKSDCFILLS